ncbi:MULTISPECIES: carbohydrate ABC transporter permease [Plantibacter]|uniref:carbohydrate ABC transporter permease n=1 Tax=Plantibacter TaxID=190323 RepID=UPI001375F565|nr:sugar ABC transporter permease [Plantibacter flavus]MBD8103904.1 sugar ABC transporter permease [Plantibacter sp. CFBP 8775]MBD8467352.1 sugar ABC transporter permease [Plantibacter sp. CFBP 8798]
MVTIFLSFFSYRWNAPALGMRFTGWQNYVSLAQDQEVVEAAVWTAAFTAVTVTAELVIGMVMAVFINSRRFTRRLRALRGIVLMPLMLSGVIAGFMWRLLFDPQFGPVNDIITRLGGSPTEFFIADGPTRLVVMLAEIWLTTPFVMLILLAGMQSIPVEYDEAASVDGAGSARRFFSITLPLLRPTILVVLVIRTMDALRVFDIIYIMTRGGPGTSTATLMLYDYKFAFNHYDMGRASALSLVFLIVIAFVTLGFIRLLRRQEAS